MLGGSEIFPTNNKKRWRNTNMSDIDKAADSYRVLAVGLAILGSCGMAHAGHSTSSILSITGSDALSITGSDALSITGSDALSITGSDAELLVLGAIGYVGDGFISVLGQTVFGDFDGLGSRMTIAVYGSIDADTGGILDAQVFSVSARFGGVSYLRGIVDEVDLAGGFAVVSGMTVDYTALLSNGSAPQVGDEFAVTGWSYDGASLLIADPLLSLD